MRSETVSHPIRGPVRTSRLFFKTPEDTMNRLTLALIGASALFGTAAVAAPLTPAVPTVAPYSNIENVRMVCNENGRCWRERSGRRTVVEDSYGYAPRERYIERRGYYDGGYYDDGPRVGIGVAPGVGVGVGVGRW
jgi:hypothetical protein